MRINVVRSRSGLVTRAKRKLRRFVPMVGPLKRRLGAAPAPPRLIKIKPDAPIASLAQALDIGACDSVLAPKLSYDIVRERLPALLASAAAACTARNQACFIQVGGALEPIGTSRESQARLLRRRRSFRLLVVNGSGRLEENICVQIWREGERSTWRALYDSNPITRIRMEDPGVAHTPLPTDTSINFPIDAVYTWVNLDDPEWRTEVARYRDVSALDPDRFSQSDELMYSIRSLEVFAPWIRRIHVFSNCAPPAWFQPSSRYVWIDHREVVEPEFLPLFNSHSIETFLHRIPDLAEHFIYLNDDFLLADSVFPSTFFTFDGKSIAHLEPASSVFYLRQLVDAGAAQEWQSAAVNGAGIIHERYGWFPTKVHQHVPYALRRSVYEELERDFPEPLRAVRSSRFRAHSDVSWTSFFYHHYAYISGLGIRSTARQFMIARGTYQGPVRRRLRKAEFISVNDGDGSSTDAAFRRFKERFLRARYPIPSSAERSQ